MSHARGCDGPRIPMVVLGGFLGAGKTTLLNALLGQSGLPRLCVIVNDFGALQIDASLIRTRSADVMELDNGCVCCTLGQDLARRLMELSERKPAPELLVIEASGVSDPLRIAQVGLLGGAFSLNSVVVAVDVQRIEQQLADPQVGDTVRLQLAGASAVALTRLDCTTRQQVERTRILVEGLNPHAPVLAAPRGRLAREVFLDETRELRHRACVPVASEGSFWRSSVPRHQELGSFVLHTDETFDKQALKTALRGLPWRVIRAKGFVRLAGRPGYCLLQMVGARIAISPAPESCRGGLVVLGCFESSDHAVLEGILRSALVEPTGLEIQA